MSPGQQRRNVLLCTYSCAAAATYLRDGSRAPVPAVSGCLLAERSAGDKVSR